MKTLNQLIANLNLKTLQATSSQEVLGLSIDSRKIEKDFAYFAIKGTHVDGHDFIDDAIAKGATTIFCEKIPAHLVEQINYIQTDDIATTLGLVASNFYDNPSSKMKVVGVTGTNGKTTIATLSHNLFTQLGNKVGLISTVQNLIGSEVKSSTHTTPDAISIQSLMHEMYLAGCTFVFMEVSSHAIHQQRIAGIAFDGAVFSNITHDHLDYHHTFDAYIKAKKQFFDDLSKTAFALTNLDDKRGAVMLQNTKASCYTYALKQMADFKGLVLENQLHGLLMNINQVEVHFRISGLFNAYNLLAVYGIATLLEQDKEKVLSIMSSLTGAAGRFETYRSPNLGIIGIVDYAHTPDALLNVLATIQQFDHKGKIITVVGCGGDRDKTKRPIMTTVACEHSNQVIITSDNPRTEDPEQILDEMQAGISAAYSRKLLRITDRKQAIRTAVATAQSEDIILIAGKGHEKYQEIQGVKHDFDDVAVLLNQFKELEK